MPRMDVQLGTFTVIRATGATNVIAGVLSCEVSMDNDRWPFVQATLTAPIPSRATLALWDPRLRPEILIELEQRFGLDLPGTRTIADVSEAYAGADLAAVTQAAVTDNPAADTLAGFAAGVPAPADISTAWDGATVEGTALTVQLFITDLITDFTAGTVTLTASSGEFRLDDVKRISPYTTNLGTRTLYSLAEQVVGMVGGTLSHLYADPLNLEGTVFTGEETDWNPGESCAEFINPILELKGLRLYCTGSTDYSLAPIGETMPPAEASSFNLHADTGMVSASRTLSNLGTADDSAWYDGCLVQYSWISAGVAKTNFDRYPEDGTHTRARIVQRGRPGPGWSGVAQGIVARSKKRGYTVTVTHQTNYYAGPGHTAALKLPDDLNPSDYEMTAVSWSYPQGEMIVNMQNPIAQGLG